MRGKRRFAGRSGRNFTKSAKRFHPKNARVVSRGGIRF